MWNSDLIDITVKKLRSKRMAREKQTLLEDKVSSTPLGVKNLKKVRDKTLSYTSTHRGTWFSPEYDFDELQIAQDTDSYFSRSIQKKVNKLLCAGFEFTGNNTETVDYIRRRFGEFSMSTRMPSTIFMAQLYADLFRFSNCMVVKARNNAASSGERRKDLSGVTIEPVAGLFILPFETLRFKTKANGELKKVLQRMPDGQMKEFFPRDLVHFYTNKKPGFAVGTPELWPALDDIQLLRRIEENVEELIETNLFPVFHYRVGSDAMPERMTPQGERESDIVKRTVEYMPAAGVYVSDHRHEITAVGSEGRALRIDFYLTYFKNRVFAALGTSPVDMGEGQNANKSTASTMSKAMMMDVEAMSCVIKAFFDFYIINELLLEGGYDPLNPEHKVAIEFGVIDKEEKRAQENHVVQTFHGNVRDMNEVRKMLGERPWQDEQIDQTHYKMYEEPLALVKSMGPGSAAGSVLAELPGSNVTPEAVASEQKFAEKQSQAPSAGQPGAKPDGSGEGARRASAARNQPSNQTGTRSTAKTNRDLTSPMTNITIYSTDGAHQHNVSVESNINEDTFQEWIQLVGDRYNGLAEHGVSFDTVVENLLWRLRG